MRRLISTYALSINMGILNNTSTIAVEEAGVAQIRDIAREHGFEVTPTLSSSSWKPTTLFN
ncbi:hypothetical protein L3i20_v224700 [Paenibacillus sp. L3-i20]|nr:hypothetical protein L3i20_v224700 [Paenibacillus sp. L3-i20]